MCGWQKNWSIKPDISITILSIKLLSFFQVIHKTSVLINMQLYLIVSNKLQTLFLNLQPLIHDILLQEGHTAGLG